MDEVTEEMKNKLKMLDSLLRMRREYTELMNVVIDMPIQFDLHRKIRTGLKNLEDGMELLESVMNQIGE
jgi:hypothetical protein